MPYNTYHIKHDTGRRPARARGSGHGEPHIPRWCGRHAPNHQESYDRDRVSIGESDTCAEPLKVCTACVIKDKLDVRFSRMFEEDQLDESYPTGRAGGSNSKRVTFYFRNSEIPTKKGLRRGFEAGKKDSAPISPGMCHIAVQVASMQYEVLQRRDGTCVASFAVDKCSRHGYMDSRCAVLVGDMVPYAFGDGAFRADGMVLLLQLFHSGSVTSVTVVRNAGFSN